MIQDGQVKIRSKPPTAPQEHADRNGRCNWLISIVLPGTVLCALNCCKPLVMDDTAYHAYAAQIARSPLDPYGFSIHWYGRSQAAETVLAPPVFPYWWALGIRVFGDDPLAAKIWLWPWCLALSAAVYSMCRYLVPSSSIAVTWMMILSPAVLPGLNLMLDIPALTLSLAALAVFLDGESCRWSAVASGVFAGLAMQTKYTGFVLLPEFLLAAICRRQWWRSAIAIGIALAIFAGWEAFVAARYGQSHFLYHIAQSSTTRTSRHHLILPLVGLLGGVGGPIVVLAVAARGAKLPVLILTICVVIAGYCAIVFVPATSAVGASTAIVFGTIGALLLCLSVAVAGKTWSNSSNDRMLIGWLIAETAAYFVLTPWTAVRRVIGIAVMLTLLFGRAAAGQPGSRAGIRLAAGFSIVLGLFFEAVDIENASIEREAVAAIDAQIRSAHERGAIWFAGHRGWQYYAERAGWQPFDSASTEKPGDWLVVPDDGFCSRATMVPSSAVLQSKLEFHSRWPLATIPWYYGTNAAIQRQDGPFMTLRVFRVEKPVTAK